MELKIVDIRQETAEVKSFYLRPLSLFPVAKAGQFITLIHTIGKTEIRRSYSLSETTGAGQDLRITLKRIPNGIMSRLLCDRSKVGDILLADSAPTGRFSLPDESLNEKTLWLFATGIGITPIFSVLQDWLRRSSGEAVLIYSNHSRSSTVFMDELGQLQQEYPTRLRIIWLWSDSQNLLQARLSKESFPWLLKTFLTQAREKVLAYLCGPAPYMWLCQLLLQDAGLDATQIRHEQFVINTEPQKRLPADKETHLIHLHWKGQDVEFEIRYPQTILQSAGAAGFALPYSCESGQCGSCTMRCTEGHVWMSYNEVLTENDLKKGLVLTCTGHVVGGEVRLREL